MSGRWNYQVVEIQPLLKNVLFGTRRTPEDVQAELNRYGQQGWELVQVVVTTPMAPKLAVFKRPA